jgi:hypothetical protein
MNADDKDRTLENVMKTLLSSIAAALIAITTTALASPLPSSTDEARKLAGASTGTFSSSMLRMGLPSSTDEARAGSSSGAVARAPCAVASNESPTTTDEARSLAARADRAPSCVASR